MLKHISTLKGQTATLSGLREAYFGALLHRANQTVTGAQQGMLREGLDHIVRFVESFQVGSCKPDFEGALKSCCCNCLRSSACSFHNSILVEHCIARLVNGPFKLKLCFMLAAIACKMRLKPNKGAETS